ncbi:Hypothetical predicted protein [Octopus vulgaris]|uniref:Uncharacterized protein n=1 Tax=Octopus vulgaris TaxID=6645 RepID=A0AA36F288_OCTVU|nr:Hypothetical predicted protein [Octopus vulgaris]
MLISSRRIMNSYNFQICYTLDIHIYQRLLKCCPIFQFANVHRWQLIYVFEYVICKRVAFPEISNFLRIQ